VYALEHYNAIHPLIDLQLPVQINELNQLGFLELSQNAIEFLPQLDKLDKLEEFYIAKNKLKELPGTLASLQALTLVDVSDNYISHLPKELLTLMADNNSFGLQIDNNPLCEEGMFNLWQAILSLASRCQADRHPGYQNSLTGGVTKQEITRHFG
jgi:hypothetical protein